MAAAMVLIKCFCVLLIVGTIKAASSSDYTNLIASLYKKAVKSHRPLVIVLDKKNSNKNRYRLEKSSEDQSSSSSEELSRSRWPHLASHLKKKSRLQNQQSHVRNDRAHLDSNDQRVQHFNPRTEQKNHPHIELYEIRERLDHQPNHRERDHRGRISGKSRQNLLSRWSSLEKSRGDNREHQRGHSRGWNFDDEQSLEDRTRNQKSYLRSPVVKGLLALRNSLSCGARDECQDQCAEPQEDECEVQCEQKYECKEDDQDDYQDPCEDPTDNGCGGQQTGSTKGALMSKEATVCKRC